MKHKKALKIKGLLHFWLGILGVSRACWALWELLGLRALPAEYWAQMGVRQLKLPRLAEAPKRLAGFGLIEALGLLACLGLFKAAIWLSCAAGA